MTQITNRLWHETSGHPLEDAALVYTDPSKGLAILAVADGITSNWGKNEQIKQRLAKDRENPPFALAQDALNLLRNGLVYLANREQDINQEKINALLFKNKNRIEEEAHGFLQEYGFVNLQTTKQKIPFSFTAGTTLSAAAYLKGTGLIMINIGDGLVKLGDHKLQTKFGEPLSYLGTGQKTDQQQKTLPEIPPFSPQILIIPEDKLKIYKNIPLWISTDGEKIILDQLTAEESTGYFRNESAKKILQRIWQFHEAGLEDDATVLLTTPYDLFSLVKPSSQPIWVVFPQITREISR